MSRDRSRPCYSRLSFPSGAALTFALYDHALTFSAELDTIWVLELGVSKVVFLLNRYGAEAILLFVAYGELL